MSNLKLCSGHFAQGADFLSLHTSLGEMSLFEGMVGFIVAAQHCKSMSLCDLYHAFDIDADGLISLDDFLWSFSSLGFKDLEDKDLDLVVNFFRFMDPTRTGFIPESIWVSKLQGKWMIPIPCAEYGEECFNHSTDSSVDRGEQTNYSFESDLGPGDFYLPSPLVDNFGFSDQYAVRTRQKWSDVSVALEQIPESTEADFIGHESFERSDEFENQSHGSNPSTPDKLKDDETALSESKDIFSFLSDRTPKHVDGNGDHLAVSASGRSACQLETQSPRTGELSIEETYPLGLQLPQTDLHSLRCVMTEVTATTDCEASGLCVSSDETSSVQSCDFVCLDERSNGTQKALSVAKGVEDVKPAFTGEDTGLQSVLATTKLSQSRKVSGSLSTEPNPNRLQLSERDGLHSESRAQAVNTKSNAVEKLKFRIENTRLRRTRISAREDELSENENDTVSHVNFEVVISLRANPENHSSPSPRSDTNHGQKAGDLKESACQTNFLQELSGEAGAYTFCQDSKRVHVSDSHGVSTTDPILPLNINRTQSATPMQATVTEMLLERSGNEHQENVNEVKFGDCQALLQSTDVSCRSILSGAHRTDIGFEDISANQDMPSLGIDGTTANNASVSESASFTQVARSTSGTVSDFFKEKNVHDTPPVCNSSVSVRSISLSQKLAGGETEDDAKKLDARIKSEIDNFTQNKTSSSDKCTVPANGLTSIVLAWQGQGAASSANDIRASDALPVSSSKSKFSCDKRMDGEPEDNSAADLCAKQTKCSVSELLLSSARNMSLIQKLKEEEFSDDTCSMNLGVSDFRRTRTTSDLDELGRCKTSVDCTESECDLTTSPNDLKETNPIDVAPACELLVSRTMIEEPQTASIEDISTARELGVLGEEKKSKIEFQLTSSADGADIVQRNIDANMDSCTDSNKYPNFDSLDCDLIHSEVYGPDAENISVAHSLGRERKCEISTTTAQHWQNLKELLAPSQHELETALSSAETTNFMEYPTKSVLVDPVHTDSSTGANIDRRVSVEIPSNESLKRCHVDKGSKDKDGSLFPTQSDCGVRQARLQHSEASRTCSCAHQPLSFPAKEADKFHSLEHTMPRADTDQLEETFVHFVECQKFASNVENVEEKLQPGANLLERPIDPPAGRSKKPNMRGISSTAKSDAVYWFECCVQSDMCSFPGLKHIQEGTSPDISSVLSPQDQTIDDIQVGAYGQYSEPIFPKVSHNVRLRILDNFDNESEGANQPEVLLPTLVSGRQDPSSLVKYDDESHCDKKSATAAPETQKNSFKRGQQKLTGRIKSNKRQTLCPLPDLVVPTKESCLKNTWQNESIKSVHTQSLHELGDLSAAQSWQAEILRRHMLIVGETEDFPLKNFVPEKELCGKLKLDLSAVHRQKIKDERAIQQQDVQMMSIDQANLPRRKSQKKAECKLGNRAKPSNMSLFISVGNLEYVKDPGCAVYANDRRVSSKFLILSPKFIIFNLNFCFFWQEIFQVKI